MSWCSGQVVRHAAPVRPSPQGAVLRCQGAGRQLPACYQISCRPMPAACHAVTVNELQVLSDAAGFNPAALLLPGMGAAIAGAAALRFFLYSQLEVITAKMLSKHVPTGGTGARVIQLGGGTRELYYYPKDVVLVTNVGEKVNKGLMEQAGVTAAVPTRVRQQPITDLSFQPASSVDAVVALGVLSELEPQQQQQCLQEVSRVLKPGMPLVFIEPLADEGSSFRGLVGVSAGKSSLSSSQLESWKQNAAFSYIEWNIALAGQDPMLLVWQSGQSVAALAGRMMKQKQHPQDEEGSNQRQPKGSTAATADQPSENVVKA